jgi:hypothetical protein
LSGTLGSCLALDERGAGEVTDLKGRVRGIRSVASWCNRILPEESERLLGGMRRLDRRR